MSRLLNRKCQKELKPSNLVCGMGECEISGPLSTMECCCPEKCCSPMYKLWSASIVMVLKKTTFYKFNWIFCKNISLESAAS